MDIQPCLDYFGVITYVTDYYMKDDTGTLKFIDKVLKESSNESYKRKLELVKIHFSLTDKVEKQRYITSFSPICIYQTPILE